MGECRPHPPVLLLLAVFSRYDGALDWARRQAVEQFGPVLLASDVFDFDETDYYDASMGSGLKKMLLAFQRPIEPPQLVSIKHLTNAWEAEYCRIGGWPEPRPLNLDPGYLTEAKLVLATTKDRDHRLYLDRGIYAEVTLTYRRTRGWCGREWTYADYRGPNYHPFLDQCRKHLRMQRHES